MGQRHERRQAVAPSHGGRRVGQLRLGRHKLGRLADKSHIAASSPGGPPVSAKASVPLYSRAPSPASRMPAGTGADEVADRFQTARHARGTHASAAVLVAAIASLHAAAASCAPGVAAAGPAAAAAAAALSAAAAHCHT